LYYRYDIWVKSRSSSSTICLSLLILLGFDAAGDFLQEQNQCHALSVKLQNKAVHVVNDVPLMESITPHYISLVLLKFPDIVTMVQSVTICEKPRSCDQMLIALCKTLQIVQQTKKKERK